jgi:hypothetical protein
MINYEYIAETNKRYKINNHGVVLSCVYKKHKELKQQKHRDGYKKVYLTVNGKTKGHFVHRLVAKTFIENPQNKPCVNHKDGNKTNNFVENLEWCTVSENVKHSYDKGLHENKNNGEKHHSTNLSELSVRSIRRANNYGVSKTEISKLFKVSLSTIKRICSYKTWKHI